MQRPKNTKNCLTEDTVKFSKILLYLGFRDLIFSESLFATKYFDRIVPVLSILSSQFVCSSLMDYLRHEKIHLDTHSEIYQRRFGSDCCRVCRYACFDHRNLRFDGWFCWQGCV